MNAKFEVEVYDRPEFYRAIISDNASEPPHKMALNNEKLDELLANAGIVMHQRILWQQKQ